VTGVLRGRASSGAALLLAAALASTGCSRAPERPDVLLVTIDTLRADHCSAYGYARPTTPRLEELARRGVLFEAAYAPMATTAPSHATMFTGLLPLWHGLVKNGHVLSPRHRLLATALSEAGYRTHAVVGSFALDRRFGLAGGFADYDDRFSGRDPSVKTPSWEGHAVAAAFDRRADETRERAVEWLRANGYLERERPPGQAPFFLWVHFFDPHSPYDPPSAHRERFPPEGPHPLAAPIAAYDGEVHYADAQLGALVDALAAAERLDRTFTLVAADHGEGLMQHGHMEHGLHLYEEAVRVPLVAHWPAALAPRRVAGPVQLADVAPTVAELAGLSWAVPAGQGRSLAAALRGRDPGDPAREVLLQRRRYDEPLATGRVVKGQQYGLRSGRWKYIESREEGTFELYDLVADPREERNLLPSAPAEAAALPARLASVVRSAPPAAAASAVGEEDARKLRSLGYVQ
jgi:arylsulfatase A-like enzyme